jgi:sulfur relay (sulfurtransferase) complex TusBCD TusD component (DsrE family)
MKLVLIVRAGPYAFQHMQTVTDLANAALDKGHQVGFFLAEDSVVAMNASSKTGSERNMTATLTDLSARGVDVQGCGACCQFRGQKRADLAEGFRVAGIASLAKMIGEADRVLSFGY